MGVAWIVGAILLAPVVLLALPLDVAFRLEAVERFDGQVTIRWLFGLVRVRFPVARSGAARRTQRPAPPLEPEAAPAPRKPARRGARPHVFAVLGQAAFRRRVYRLARDLVRAAHLRGLELRLRLGLGDPADTGRLWALVGPLGAFARNLRRADVRIEPAFTDPVFELRAQGQARLVPLQLLALAVAFVLSPASIRAWLTLRGGRA
jgi:hypothetical protein